MYRVYTATHRDIVNLFAVYKCQWSSANRLPNRWHNIQTSCWRHSRHLRWTFTCDPSIQVFAQGRWLFTYTVSVDMLERLSILTCGFVSRRLPVVRFMRQTAHTVTCCYILHFHWPFTFQIALVIYWSRTINRRTTAKLLKAMSAAHTVTAATSTWHKQDEESVVQCFPALHTGLATTDCSTTPSTVHNDLVSPSALQD